MSLSNSANDSGTVYIEVVVKGGSSTVFGTVLISLSLAYVFVMIVYLCVRRGRTSRQEARGGYAEADSNFTSVDDEYFSDTEEEVYDSEMTQTSMSYYSDDYSSPRKGTMSNSSISKISRLQSSSNNHEI